MDGMRPELSRLANPLLAPFWVLGITLDRSIPRYSSPVPVPLTPINSLALLAQAGKIQGLAPALNLPCLPSGLIMLMSLSVSMVQVPDWNTGVLTYPVLYPKPRKEPVTGLASLDSSGRIPSIQLPEVLSQDLITTIKRGSGG